MDLTEIRSKACRFLENADNESFLDKNGSRLFESVSVGAQSASHPVFGRIAAHIDRHLEPREFFSHKFGDTPVGEGLSVISFAFHISSKIIADNSHERLHPSYSWYEARYAFEGIIEPFTAFLQNLLNGRRIAVPYKSPLYIGMRKPPDTTAEVPFSNWSERHVAFACGLGSFGLHGALITDKGCTHRLLSVVTDHEFDRYEDVPEDLYFNCLYFQNGTCGKCISRCPVNSVTPDGHILTRCYSHEMVTNKAKSLEIFGREVAACALCMCGVPCSVKKPVQG